MKRALSFFALLLAYGTAHGEPRKVGDFHAVDLAGALGVEITVGKPQAVEVTGEPELLSKVTLTVKNGVLVIETEKHLKKNHLKVAISVPQLDNVTLSGAGEMTVSGVNTSALSIHMPGAGTVKASGEAGALHVNLDGTGEVNTKSLKAKTTTIELGGTGQVSAIASDAVDASLSGTGQIDVGGNPAKVKKSMTGVGQISIR